jgi:hypothetical protein
MGNEIGRPSLVHRICWWLAELALQLLDPDERSTVRGDLIEIRANGRHALGETLGLVARRQAALWSDWRPWLAVTAIVVPLGFLLSRASQWWADVHAVYAYPYTHGWTWGFLTIPGARRDLFYFSAQFALSCAALVGWSWTAGFVLGTLSRRMLWVTAPLFCCVILFGSAGMMTAPMTNNPDSVVFASTFYRVTFPRLLRTVVVLLPALLGLYWSVQRPSLPLLPTLVGSLALALLTVWKAEGLVSSALYGRIPIWPDPGVDGVPGTADDRPPPWLLFLLWLIPLVMTWPAVYLATTAIWQKRRGTRISA